MGLLLAMQNQDRGWKVSKSTALNALVMLLSRGSYLNTSSTWKPFFLHSWERKVLRLAPIFLSRRNNTTSGNLMEPTSPPSVAPVFPASGQATFLRFSGTMVPGGGTLSYGFHVLWNEPSNLLSECVPSNSDVSFSLSCQPCTFSRSFLTKSFGYFIYMQHNLKIVTKKEHTSKQRIYHPPTPFM